MGYDTGLADRLRAKGVEVVEVDGWTTRGSSTYAPLLALWHHTAGSRSGAVPSLATCIYGRPDVPGPLCQVLQSRDSDGVDRAYVIAAGKANHGGAGEWRGVSGNSKAFGLEVEHIGTTTQPGARHEISARILAAGLEGPGGSRNAANCCRHAEYATPRGRKIDFNIAATPWTAGGMRARVAHWIGRTATTPQEDTFMAGLTEDQQKELYRHIVGDGRLEEVTLNTRALLAKAPGYFAKTPESEARGEVYYVGGDHQHYQTMEIGGPLHEWIKTLHRLIGASERAVPLTEDKLPDAA